MEELVGVLVGLLLLAICAYGLAGGIAFLIACGFFLTIKALIAITVVLVISFGIWAWRLSNPYNYRAYMNRVHNFQMAGTFALISLAIVWGIASFQTEWVQTHWKIVSTWAFRSDY